MSLNQCQFIGNLGKDPETRPFQDGNKVTNFSVACSEKWKDKNTGERREKTEWVNVAAFGPLAGIAEQYLRKGSKVFVSGKMQTRKWQDQSGQDRYSTEIVLQGFDAKMVMLDAPKGNHQQDQQGGDYGGGQSYGGGRSDLDQEIPFAPEWRA